MKLECIIDQIVKFDSISWYKNDIKLHNNQHLLIDKRHSNEYTFIFLAIKYFKKSDEGTYTCKFEDSANHTIDVYLNDINYKNLKASSMLNLFILMKGINNCIFCIFRFA